FLRRAVERDAGAVRLGYQLVVGPGRQQQDVSRHQLPGLAALNLRPGCPGRDRVEGGTLREVEAPGRARADARHQGAVDPAEVLEGFGRIVAEQAAVDYTARAPKVGDRAPDFSLPDQLGRHVSLGGELEQGPVVLIFYRGEWCPYCNAMLRTYGLRAADFSQRGARLVAVSPQTPDNSLT